MTVQTGGYVDVGNGACRIDGEDAKGYGHWGWGDSTDDDGAKQICNEDPKCMAFWDHPSSDKYQFFCSEATNLCNKGNKGTVTKPSDLKGSGTQGGGSCFIKPRGMYNHKEIH